mmetsp:Transcript_7418/g.10657  ORF Transcript_7418/g.10657 Transcript_7418/m.10657 type:complete len:110 (-) Transcript_7418:68-397(-)
MIDLDSNISANTGNISDIENATTDTEFSGLSPTELAIAVVVPFLIVVVVILVLIWWFCIDMQPATGRLGHRYNRYKMGGNTRDGGGEHTVDHEKEGGANDDWTVPEGDK